MTSPASHATRYVRLDLPPPISATSHPIQRGIVEHVGKQWPDDIGVRAGRDGLQPLGGRVVEPVDGGLLIS